MIVQYMPGTVSVLTCLSTGGNKQARVEALHAPDSLLPLLCYSHMERKRATVVRMCEAVIIHHYSTRGRKITMNGAPICVRH